ncbi:unnamed protein product [Rotaria socialis]|nr:unnamed protein product [Rotaria socialis]
MLDTGANRTFISITALHPLNSKQFVNKSYKRVILADGYTSLSILGTWELSIFMGDMLTSIEAFVVKELCADCILGMDFNNKYKLIINTEEQMVSICNNHHRTTLTFDVSKGNINYPTRLINNIRIPPKRTVSVPVSVGLSSAKVLFRPSYKLQQRSSILMLNSSLTVQRHTSSILVHNPTNYSYSLPKGIILGTTTIPTLSFKRNETIDQQLVNKNIISLSQHIGDYEQQKKIKIILNQHAKLFDTSKPTVATGVKPHAIKTLDHPPPTSKPYYTTPNKQEENDQYRQDYPSFEIPTSYYNVVHVNKYTSIEEMHMLINHVQECTQFTIDTESEKSNGQLALIQLQTIPSRLPSLVILIELAHLPSNDSHVCVKIKEFFELIFRSNNELYSWGDMIKELDPIKNSALFKWPTLASLLDIQPHFPGWYEWALTHSESCCPKHHLDDANNVNIMSQNYLSSIFYCPRQSPYRPNELWSLQNALIYAAHIFIDKSSTVNNWAGGLTTNNSTLSSFRRKKMIKYAIYDVLSTTYLIRPISEYWTFQKLKNTNIIDLFTSFKSSPLPSLPTNKSSKNKSIKKNINPQKLFKILDDDLELISDDDEIYLNQLIAPVTNQKHIYEEISNDEQELNITVPVNNVDLIVNEANEIIIDNNEQTEPDENIEQHHILSHQRRSIESRQKKIENETTHVEFKQMLKQNDVQYINVKVVNGLLRIGVKNEKIKQNYQQKISENMFDRQNYQTYRHHRHHRKRQQQH